MCGGGADRWFDCYACPKRYLISLLYRSLDLKRIWPKHVLKCMTYASYVNTFNDFLSLWLGISFELNEDHVHLDCYRHVCIVTANTLPVNTEYSMYSTSLNWHILWFVLSLEPFPRCFYATLKIGLFFLFCPTSLWHTVIADNLLLQFSFQRDPLRWFLYCTDPKLSNLLYCWQHFFKYQH